MRYLTRFLPNWRTAIILLPIVLLGPIIRWIPVTSKYPIGGDAGSYFTVAAAYAKTWPLFPATVPIIGNIPTGSEVLPLLSWLMAMLNRLFGLDLYTVTKITPLLICAFGSISIYLLAKQVTGRQDIGLIAALFYSTSKFNLWIPYPAYSERVELGLVFITLYFLFILKIVTKVNEEGKKMPEDSWRNMFFAALSLFGIISSHDRAMVAFFIIISVFTALLLLFDTRRFIRKTALTLFNSILLGVLFSLPIIVFFREFLFQRVLRVSGASSGVEGYVPFYANLPSVPYGYLVSLFVLIGAVLLIKKRPKSSGIYLLLGWLLILYLFSKLYIFGIYFLDLGRFIYYIPVPMAIVAAIGLFEVIAWASKMMSGFKRFDLRKIAIPCIIGLIVVLQVHEAVSTAELSKTARPAHPYLNEKIEQAILWLKDNTAEDSIIFTPALSPYAANHYIPGISGRAYLLTPDPGLPPGQYTEYVLFSEARQAIGLEDPETTFEILEKYSHEYSEGYVFIGKKQINFANAYGENIDLERLGSYYQQVFENREIVIYRAYPIE